MAGVLRATAAKRSVPRMNASWVIQDGISLMPLASLSSFPIGQTGGMQPEHRENDVTCAGSNMHKLFICYSHDPKDENLKEQVKQHLQTLTSSGLSLDIWDDRRIAVGDDWLAQIKCAINECSAAVLLLSPGFLCSRFIQSVEVPELLQRRREQGIRVIPVNLSPCYLEPHRWLYDMQSRPGTNKHLSGLSPHEADEALVDLVKEIAALVMTITPSVQNKHPANSAVGGRPRLDDAAGKSDLFGRAELLEQLTFALGQHDAVGVFGFRGNGKSSLLRQLQSNWRPDEWLHMPAGVASTRQALFTTLAEILGERAERPTLPDGSVTQVEEHLRNQYPDARGVVIWVDRAHLWFDGPNWLSAELATFVRAARRAFRDRWTWVFELGERPPAALAAMAVTMIEVPGLERESLGKWLAAAAPKGQELSWQYSGTSLKRIYGWLGGGQGKHAHPLATRLLIEVARAKAVAPLDALVSLLGAIEQRIESQLLAELYDRLLSEDERRMLQVLSLYRNSIPHGHIDTLEQRLGTPGGWEGLDRRCMVASEGLQSCFYLHGFVAGWVRHRLGYPDASEDGASGDLPSTVGDDARQVIERLHSVVADCWLDSLTPTQRVTQQNILSAVEATHHATAAGRTNAIDAVSMDLLRGHGTWALQRLWEHDEKLRTMGASPKDQVQVLRLITKLDPREHRAWRFQGELLHKLGAKRTEVLSCHEQALAGNPDYPPYLANVGARLLLDGREGANRFLSRLDKHRIDHPQAINDAVTVIEAECLEKTGRGPEASQLRRGRIHAGSGHPPLFSAEATYWVVSDDLDKAAEIISQAKARRASDDFTASIEAMLLEKTGNGPAASKLRQERIGAKTRNAAIYSAEASYLLANDTPEAAAAVLDVARKRGISESELHITRAVGKASIRRKH